jgi:TonB family protein
VGVDYHNQLNLIMKKLICLVFLFQFINLNAQENLTYFDENGQKTTEGKSSVLLQRVKLNDTLWQFNVYDTKGPRIKTIQSNNENGNIVNGEYITYDFGGYIDTLGYAYNNTKEKTWEIYAHGRLVKQITYENGTVIKERDSTEIHESIKKHKDSVDALSDNNKPKEIQSKFQNGDRDWQNYMFKNMHYPDQLINDGIGGTVIIQFVITAEGKVEDTEVFKSSHYLLDESALKLVNNSVGWQPASQNGRKVKSYKKQPIVFQIQTR